ncbi:hypothetical protein [Microbacterium sp. H1-D42]|uniref:hypothetical protein n=1 Tax=Microbacterium sp. H1-D42 TaxID=2925844 RepID=UPI001F52F204|nr:hypothetical protein [Microbacterium sp. H1-D42]UNK70857.1 hypothetical protein MNR00_17155 [Microbacterium sp. H1-D42]
MDSLEQTTRVGTTRGVGVLVAGVALALWIVLGRFLFGAGGELTIAYLPIGVVVIVLYAFLGRAIARTANRGFTTRPSTWGTLIVACICGVLFGLTIPDITADGLQTIVSGTQQPALDIAIGVTNPAWVIMFAFTIISLVLATQDSRGPRPEEDEEF